MVMLEASRFSPNEDGEAARHLSHHTVAQRYLQIHEFDQSYRTGFFVCTEIDTLSTTTLDKAIVRLYFLKAARMMPYVAFTLVGQTLSVIAPSSSLRRVLKQEIQLQSVDLLPSLILPTTKMSYEREHQNTIEKDTPIVYAVILNLTPPPRPPLGRKRGEDDLQAIQSLSSAHRWVNLTRESVHSHSHPLHRASGDVLAGTLGQDNFEISNSRIQAQRRGAVKARRSSHVTSQIRGLRASESQVQRILSFRLHLSRGKSLDILGAPSHLARAVARKIPQYHLSAKEMLSASANLDH